MLKSPAAAAKTEREHEGEELGPEDVDAGETRGVGIAAGGEEMIAEEVAVEDQVADERHAQEPHELHRDRAEIAGEDLG